MLPAFEPGKFEINAEPEPRRAYQPPAIKTGNLRSDQPAKHRSQFSVLFKGAKKRARESKTK